MVVRLLPASRWLSAYSFGFFRSDLMAAVIVTIMLIPQSLAYAMLAGLPPVVGLYASMLPLIGYALFGSSNTLAVGPVAVVSLMTATAAAEIAAPGTQAYHGAAIALALLSGLCLILLGILRLGFLSSLLSHPVISGFISASGVLIAASQLKHIAGVEATGHSLPELIQSLSANAGVINLNTLILGIGVVGFLLWVRFRLKVLLERMGVHRGVADALAKAGPVVAVITTIVLVKLLALDSTGVRVVGEIPTGLPDIELPAFDPELWRDLFWAAVLISIVGFVESVSVAQTLAARRRERIRPNDELVGLGAANLSASLSGGYPVTGGFARSVVNFDAGARTPMAGVLTAAGIGMTAMFFTPMFELLPKATLAATILVAVLSLVDIPAIKRTWVYSKADFSAMMLTILVVLLVGIEAGISAGVAASLVLFVVRSARPHIAVVGQVPGTGHFRNVLRHEVVTSPRVLSVRVDESLYFANARWLEDQVYDLAIKNSETQHVVLVCSAVNAIDVSALESLESLAARLDASGIAFHLSEVKGPVMDRLQRSNFFDHLTGKVFMSHYQAMLELDPETTTVVADSQVP